MFANYSMLMRYSIIEETAEEKAAKGEESGSEERITNNHQETHAK